MSTFRLSDDGRLFACVTGGSSAEFEGYVQVYSPEYELVEQFGLPFSPTAIDLDSSGNMFVGGMGTLCKMNPEGEILLTTGAPNLEGVDFEELKAEAMAEAEAMMERQRESIQSQIDATQAQIDELLAEQESEGELSRTEQRKLDSLERRLEAYERMTDQQAEINEQMIELRLQSKGSITTIAVTERDVFVSTAARSGSGYEVYRMTHTLEDAEQVVNSLRGCCGQMDIHAMDDRIYIAENCKFNVGVYDRDGDEVQRFGAKLSGENQGFGGCCNPMNVICCPDGEVLTAESSLGKIKRYDADGELIQYVGEASLGGGCKHVAIGFDQVRDRYYVQNAGPHEICVRELKDAENE
ncbi:MAG: hypothetical protein AAF456_15485 [Planctomycetota bacterium]